MEEAYKKEQEELAKLAIKRYRLAKQDHYGGKTPEETLKLFVEALKKKDAELAARYCLPWKYDYCREYVKEWFEKYSGGLHLFVGAHEEGIIKNRPTSSPDRVKLYIYSTPTDKYPYIIKLQLNKITGVWKIEKF